MQEKDLLGGGVCKGVHMVSDCRIGWLGEGQKCWFDTEGYDAIARGFRASQMILRNNV